MSICSRKSTRLQSYDYAQQGFYYVTICVVDRKEFLGNIYLEKMHLNSTGEIVLQELQNLACHYDNICLHEYVIMPNHLHAILEIVDKRLPGAASGAPTVTLGNVVRGFKSGVTRITGRKIWQRGYYEHVIRDAIDYQCIATYIQNNPQNWNKDDEKIR